MARTPSDESSGCHIERVRTGVRLVLSFDERRIHVRASRRRFGGSNVGDSAREGASLHGGVELGKRVLFIGPLPEPITGQSLACQVFLDELEALHVEVVDLAKREFANGLSSLSRIGGVLRILGHVWRQRDRRGCDLFHRVGIGGGQRKGPVDLSALSKATR